MNGVQIRGDSLDRLCRVKRLTGASLGATIKTSARHIYRLKSGQPTSLRLLDRMVPVFGVAQVAALIVDDEQREIFLAAHKASL